MLQSILKLREQGLSVIPVAGKRAKDKDAAKLSLIEWREYQKRLPSVEELRGWFTVGEGEIAPDVAVVTGSISRLLVLDVDGDEGVESLKSVPIPPTWTVKTKRGRHHYFKWVPALEGRTTTKVGILPKVDTRGDGGYVIAPPSKGFNGTPYTWERGPETPLAEPPSWLIEMLPRKGVTMSVVPKSDSWMLDELNAIKPGAGAEGRTPTFVRAIGRLKAKGLLPEEAKKFLLPWAEKHNYDRLDYLIADQYSRYPVVPSDLTESPVDDFLANASKVDWISPNLIAKQTIGFMAGLPETMKTWVLLDLAIEAARGDGLWLGRFPVAKCRTMVIDQERPRVETQRRVGGLVLGKGIDPRELRGYLDVRCGTTIRIDQQDSYNAFRRLLSAVNPELIIVDSFATFHTKEESNRMEIQLVLERIKALRAEFGVTFLFVHHETKLAYQAAKDKQDPTFLDMAGNVAIPAAAETVFNVRRQDPLSSFVFHTKSTVGTKTPPFLVRVVDLNDDKSAFKVETF